MAGVNYPNESDDYRKARNALLEAERELRGHVERVATLRRELPLGGELKEDYVFDELVDGVKSPAKLSELFAPGKDTLFLYGFMFGPDAEVPCPLCTSFLDSLDASAKHIEHRIGLAVAARAPIKTLRAFADGRSWNSLRLVSSHDNSFQSDYHAEKSGAGQMPMANVFVRRGGKIHHHWGSEMLYAPSDGDLDSRHLDMMWPIWNVFDTTPEGRGDFYPKLSY